MENVELSRLERKLTKELLWLYVLSVLRKKALHAYVLRKEIKARFGFMPGNVTPYVVLYKLESRGYVKTKNEGNKIVYSITPKGEGLFSEAKQKLKNKFDLLF